MTVPASTLLDWTLTLTPVTPSAPPTDASDTDIPLRRNDIWRDCRGTAVQLSRSVEIDPPRAWERLTDQDGARGGNVFLGDGGVLATGTNNTAAGLMAASALRGGGNAELLGAGADVSSGSDNGGVALGRGAVAPAGKLALGSAAYPFVLHNVAGGIKNYLKVNLNGIIKVLPLYENIDPSFITVFPTGSGECVAWSHDGTLLAVAHATSPYLSMYRTSDWSKVANPTSRPAGNAHWAAFSPDDSLVAIAHASSPYISVYNAPSMTKRSESLGGGWEGLGASFNSGYLACGFGLGANPNFKLLSLSDWSSHSAVYYTQSVWSVDWSSNGSFISVVEDANTHIYAASSPWTLVYTLGFTFSVSDYRPHGKFSPDSTKLAVVGPFSGGVHLTVFSTSTWAAIPPISAQPSSTTRAVAWSHDGSKIAIGYDDSPYITIYETTAWTTISGPSVSPGSRVNALAWSNNDALLAVAHNSSPYLTVYNTSTWVKLS